MCEYKSNAITMCEYKIYRDEASCDYSGIKWHMLLDTRDAQTHSITLIIYCKLITLSNVNFLHVLQVLSSIVICTHSANKV